METARSYYNDFLPHFLKDHMRDNPRHVRVKKSLELLASRGLFKPGASVLDVGCGTGISSKFLGEMGGKVVAVDLADKLIEFARIHSAHPSVEYMVGDATDLNLGRQFDLITIIDCLEHIPLSQRHKFMSSLSNHTTSSTLIYLNVPDSRFQSYVKEHKPHCLQLIDEVYSFSLILDLFSSIGFQAVHTLIYGIDANVQYDDFMFMSEVALKSMYRAALDKV